MSSEALVIAVVAVRVLFLALFLGAFLWLLAAFESGADLLPPPQRLALIRRVGSRFMAISWVFFIAMSIGGMGSAVVIDPGDFSSMSSLGGLTSLLATPRGLILGLEVVVTVLILACIAAIQFVFLKRVGGTQIAVAESDDKSLKWLTATDSKRALGAVSSITWLCIANIVLGVVAIALGVLYSSV
jgi:uncharacterized membrane protein